MFDRPECVLVMADGDLPSVLAAATARESMLSRTASAGAPALWPAYDPADDRRANAVAKLAAATGLSLMLRRALSVGPSEIWTSPSRVLMDACTDAAAESRTEILWPAQFAAARRSGPHQPPVDLDLVTRAVDRALLVTRLMSLDAGVHGLPALHIETPYVDLTDRQIADLVVDVGAPVPCCWWWDGSDDEALAARARWAPHLSEAGYRLENPVR